ncbi:MAG: hypothetical protein KDH94_04910, partial [Coxiellaceae bacterium]|nr:hypothetical protein [Coxiellaceae bacterium]
TGEDLSYRVLFVSSQEYADGQVLECVKPGSTSAEETRIVYNKPADITRSCDQVEMTLKGSENKISGELMPTSIILEGEYEQLVLLGNELDKSLNPSKKPSVVSPPAIFGLGGKSQVSNRAPTRPGANPAAQINAPKSTSSGMPPSGFI